MGRLGRERHEISEFKQTHKNFEPGGYKSEKNGAKKLEKF